MNRNFAQPQITITGHTQLVGLFGWPVEHSVSPPMQNAAFAALGLDWCYLPFAVAPDAIAEALRGVVALGLRGVNVTVPHKQVVLDLVDELTPQAHAIHAVNTLIISDEGRVTGHNTDAAGFLRALRETGFEPEGCQAIMLGAGGAARAVGYALASVGARLSIANRTPERADALATDLRAVCPDAAIEAFPLHAGVLEQLAPRADLIVNTTSAGMWPAIERTPWPEDVGFPDRALLFDLIYNPPETLLMRQARQQGAQAINGLTMLVHQGAEAFRLWTGVEAPVEVMVAACQAALRGVS